MITGRIEEENTLLHCVVWLRWLCGCIKKYSDRVIQEWIGCAYVNWLASALVVQNGAGIWTRFQYIFSTLCLLRGTHYPYHGARFSNPEELKQSDGTHCILQTSSGNWRMDTFKRIKRIRWSLSDDSSSESKVLFISLYASWGWHPSGSLQLKLAP